MQNAVRFSTCEGVRAAGPGRGKSWALTAGASVGLTGSSEARVALQNYPYVSPPILAKP